MQNLLTKSDASLDCVVVSLSYELLRADTLENFIMNHKKKLCIVVNYEVRYIFLLFSIKIVNLGIKWFKKSLKFSSRRKLVILNLTVK